MPRAVTWYLAGVVFLTLGLGLLCYRVGPIRTDGLVPMLVLAGIGWFSSRTQDTSGGVGLSFTNVVSVASAALVGPLGALVVGIAIPLFGAGKKRPINVAFNSSLFGVIGGVCGLLYLLLGGPIIFDLVRGTSAVGVLVAVGWPLLVANLVSLLVNALLLAGMVSASGEDSRRVLMGMIRETVPIYVGYTALSFILVVLWGPAGVGPLSAGLLIAPLVLSMWSYRQYGDEYRAHTRIVETILSACSGADRSVQAHARRVSTLAELLGLHLGLGARTARDLDYAATLHDIGRVAMPIDVLGLPSGAKGEEGGVVETPPTAEQIEIMRRHADIGADILLEVDFLKEASVGVRHHHERFDGRGYPSGLAGEDIPLISRIIAVADGMGVLLERYPEESDEQLLTRLRERSGSVYDPAIVRALSTVVTTLPWRAVRSNDPDEESPIAWRDHDDPEWSEYFAARRSGHRITPMTREEA